MPDVPLAAPVYQGTVLIPVGPEESAWTALLADLGRVLPADWEILLVGTQPAPALFKTYQNTAGSRQASSRWLQAPRGRARQLNCGSRSAHGEFLWIVHADSRLAAGTWAALQRCLAQPQDGLYYCNLRFLPGGPGLMALNTVGVWLRSHVLGLPFGDQGFCLKRATLARLGGFDEQALYGEDHLLVWSAKRCGLPVRCIGASLATSARKYADNGWLKTTLHHLWLTLVQAAEGWHRCRS